MFRTIRVWLAWREVWRDSHWAYQENTITAARRHKLLYRPTGVFFLPANRHWLAGGEQPKIID